MLWLVISDISHYKTLLCMALLVLPIAFFLLYGVGKKRVWYNDTANSVLATTTLTMTVDWRNPLLYKGVNHQRVMVTNDWAMNFGCTVHLSVTKD